LLLSGGGDLFGRLERLDLFDIRLSLLIRQRIQPTVDRIALVSTATEFNLRQSDFCNPLPETLLMQATEN